ncbi:MAG: hypothetical protein U0Z70_18510 [Thermomicrobiales bacterium]
MAYTARWILALSLSLLTLFGPRVMPGFAQQAGLHDTVYTSPEWGYTIRWHSDEWNVVHDVGGPDVNLLMVGDDAGNFVSFTGLNDFNGNAKTCLDDMAASAISDPEHTSTSPFTYESGDPVEWHHRDQAYELLSTTVTKGDGGVEEGVLYLECQTLVPGKAVFQRLYSGSADAFDQNMDEVIAMVEGVYLPASAWLPDEDDPAIVLAGYSPLLDRGRGDASLFPADVPQLLIGLADVAGERRVIGFENLSETPVTVYPADLALVYVDIAGAGDEVRSVPTAVGWGDGFASDDSGARELAPGERAFALVDIPDIDASVIACDSIYYLGYEYRDHTGEFSDFADFDAASCSLETG